MSANMKLDTQKTAASICDKIEQYTCKHDIHVLYIEDDEDDVYLLKHMLAEDPGKTYQLIEAPNLTQARHILTTHTFDVLILDLSVGDIAGLDTLSATLHLLKLLERELPVIVFTEVDDLNLGEAAIHSGAADYLPKKRADGFHLSRTIRHAMERFALLRELKIQAQFDELTGLLSRREAMRQFQQHVDYEERAHNNLAFASFDLNKFKAINDEYGHMAGDEVLKFFAARLGAHIRKTDIAARLGGDEFVVMFAQFETKAKLVDFIQRLKSKLEADVQVFANNEVLSLEVRTSIGICIHKPCQSLKQTLALADKALYEHKKNPHLPAFIFDTPEYE